MSDIKRLADLISRRNQVNKEISDLIGRPALTGHIGEYIASKIFNIELESSAARKGIDGRFTEGALKGRTVNIKIYGKREGLLDISLENLADYYLVMAGPQSQSMTSKGAARPIVISNVYLFKMNELLTELGNRGVKIRVATSVARKYWDSAEIFPHQTNKKFILTKKQCELLRSFYYNHLSIIS